MLQCLVFTSICVPCCGQVWMAPPYRLAVTRSAAANAAGLAGDALPARIAALSLPFCARSVSTLDAAPLMLPLPLLLLAHTSEPDPIQVSHACAPRRRAARTLLPAASLLLSLLLYRRSNALHDRTTPSHAASTRHTRGGWLDSSNSNSSERVSFSTLTHMLIAAALC